MKDMVFALIPILALCIPIVAILVKSDIGHSIADAIRHNSGANDGRAVRDLEQVRAEIEQMRTELDDVHLQLQEAHERLDFAERLLSKPGESVPLPGGPVS